MKTRHRLSRRQMLRLSAVVGSFTLTSGIHAAIAQVPRPTPSRPRTPGQILGPFYPLRKPLDQDTDLTAIAGKPGQAVGQVIEIAGRVVNVAGQPVPNATIEVWQANTHGRYTHPSDRNPAPLDPNFEGYATLNTDAEGRYRFRTIKPGAYPLNPTVMRPPHIHFEVTGKHNRLVTQLYFAGEPLNDSDPFLQSAGAGKNQLIVTLRPHPDVPPKTLLGLWDIVLENG